MLDLINDQLTDPFRIGLLIALFATMLRTRAASGTIIPLAAGAVFVAVILPSTLQTGTAPLMQSVMAGVVSNVTILALILGVWTIYQGTKAK
jgi:hypothetical protein